MRLTSLLSRAASGSERPIAIAATERGRSARALGRERCDVDDGRAAFDHEIGHDFADDGRVLETVSTESERVDEPVDAGAALEDEVQIRREVVHGRIPARRLRLTERGKAMRGELGGGRD